MSSNLFDSLRAQAERRLGQESQPETPLGSEEANRLIHELRVHQIELELQNQELRHTEESLQLSRNRYQQLFEQAPVGYVVLSDSATVLEANHTFCNMVGASSSALRGRGFADFLANPHRSAFLGRFRAWLHQPKGKVVEAELLVDAGQSRSRWVMLGAGSPFENSVREAAGILITVTDIDDRKRAETELQQHHQHLEQLVEQRTSERLAAEASAQLILDSSADGLYGVDNQGQITFINPAACKLLGYSAEQVMGKPVHSLLHHSRPDGSAYPAEDCPSLRALGTGQEIHVDHEVYWHADGHAIPVLYSVHPILQNGQVQGAVVSFVDVSSQRAAETAREQALLAAEQLARARSQFLANMSHEIRTPLNGVLGFAEIGLRNRDNPETVERSFRRILDSGQLLLRVVNDVLDFSKIEAGKFSIEPVVINLRDVIAEAVAHVRDAAEAKKLQLRISVANDVPPTCMGDPERIKQVLLNLLTNALKFTESGMVSLAAERKGEHLLISVEDSGMGMTDHQVARLFSPFEQADGSSTRRHGGTGLGLAISHRLVELMGGIIEVSSRPGRGSLFRVRLPYVPSTAEDPANRNDRASSIRPAEKPLTGLTVLVVEDNEINRSVLQINLIELGAHVVLTENGREAVEYVRMVGPDAADVVLMDVQMPVMDGYEATAGILALAPRMPIIGQTAHAYCEEKERCYAVGMVGHLAKPLDPRSMLAMILANINRGANLRN